MPQYKPQSPRRLSPAEGHDLHFFPYYRVVVYPLAVFFFSYGEDAWCGLCCVEEACLGVC